MVILNTIEDWILNRVDSMRKTNSQTKAVIYLIASIVCIVASLSIGIWHKGKIDERAEIRRTGQRVTAFAVNRKEIEFTSTKGVIRTKPLVSPMKGTLKKYDSIVVIYDRDDPKKVVLQQDDSGFNITIWVVVIKLFVAGLIFGFFGIRNSQKKFLTKKQVKG